MKLPNHDEHFRKAALKGNYQRYMILRTMSYSRSWTTALDIGAHVGFTACDLAKFFGTVHAFEPQPDNYSCLVENIPANVIPHNVAVGAEEKRVSLMTPLLTNSGAWTVCDGNDVRMVTIDSLGLTDVGLIKIDVQDGEMGVLKGAAETMRRCMPVVQVELPKAQLKRAEKGGAMPDAVVFMHKLGAKLIDRIRQDVVFAW